MNPDVVREIVNKRDAKFTEIHNKVTAEIRDLTDRWNKEHSAMLDRHQAEEVELANSYADKEASLTKAAQEAINDAIAMFDKELDDLAKKEMKAALLKK